MNNKIFAYVVGMPTKGLWVDMNLIDSWDEVKEALVARHVCAEDYDGDILVADAEGLCGPFLGRYDTFDLAEFTECRDHKTHAPDEAKLVYVNWVGGWDSGGFDASYYGDFSGADDLEQAFAENYVNEVGLLSGVPENFRHYFDYKAFAETLFISDFYEVDGHIFLNC